MSDTVKMYTGGDKKGFAPDDADPNETADASKMNGLTKIFDLVREGNHDEARKRISKLSDKRRTELLVIGTWIDTAIGEKVWGKPDGTQRIVGWRG